MKTNWREVLGWSEDKFNKDKKYLKSFLLSVSDLNHGEIFAEFFNDVPITDIKKYAYDILDAEDETYFDEEESQDYLNSLKYLYETGNYKELIKMYVKNNPSHGEVAGSFVRYLIDNRFYAEAVEVMEILLNNGGFDS